MPCSHPSPHPSSLHVEGPYAIRYWLCRCGHHWTEHVVPQPKPKVQPIQAQAVAR
jgi:hypothetical protein